ncbi:OmpH family outer membrane protein [Paracoccus aurantiacus]|uniref:OmpH family outer membrane protein n=1 Tax=Paracoccus aurantiacus TaxID=2599412 RepID=A0A5C6S6S9_9RHOB|nr:OmpH family outer membrane protein [Paracoccus aurantiacus]TXB70589.1 OmpH family outer membrane protein [Paracoccus aurantiacus]
MQRASRFRPALALVAWACLAAGAFAQDTVADGAQPAEQDQPTPAPPENQASETTGPTTDQALPSGVLVLDVDHAYDISAWGQRAQDDLQAAAREIEAENKRLESQLTAEEQALTAERGTLAPDAFRKKAEAFDARAQQIRRDRAETVRELSARADADRNAFLQAALPLVAQLMQENRAAVVLYRGQALLAINSIDITDRLAERMDETVGAGGPLPEEPGSGTTAPEDAVSGTNGGSADAGESPVAPADDASAGDDGDRATDAPQAPAQ